MTRSALSVRTVLAVLASGVGAWACDNREAFRAPEPGLQRMLQQPRGDPYGQSDFFADRRVMRSPPRGSVPRERAHVGLPALSTGRDHAGYVASVPLPTSQALLQRGRAAFEEVCATCHGMLGDGQSVVAEKMELRRPPSLFEPRLVALPAGRVFEIISQGYGLMPSYAGPLSVDERWAVVAYLPALRLSQGVQVTTLPAALRAELSREAP